ncbi:MAG: ABC transporter ATP-binding protein [Oscillospiraceae bacterium]|jgi:ATP-binding cassette subfamily B protein|nr:ABC transporter ATP-binding protein [Oscillospiraceae bacterium]MBQ6030546.1 ABC transporter ATP-binding protein [Oscillospiraceae bacterium]
MIFGRHINRYYLRYGPFLFFGMIALIAVDYLQLIIPNLYQMVVNGINDGYVIQDGVQKVFDAQFLMRQILMPMVYVILSIVAGRFVWRLMFVGTAIKVEEQLRNRMFDHSRRLSQSYYQLHKVGGLMSLYTNDLDTVQECFSWGVMMFCDAVFLGVLALSKMFRMHVLLTALSLIPTALLLASATVVGKHLTKKWDIRQEAFSRLSDFSQESFSGIAVIKAFVKEGKELWAFKKLNVENEEANIAHTKASVLFRVMVTLFVESVICIILGYGGYLVYRGVFNAGQLVEFIGYFMAIVWPVMAVSDLIDMTSRGRASLKRIGELLDAEPEVVDRPNAVPLDRVRGEIEFRDLTFRYPDGEFDVLDHVSFKINAGENVGLVGKTGAGKTTIVDLILRTYNVPDGTLFIDGHDVNDVTIHSLRAGCAYVPQDNYLFSETIEENISFALDDSDPERVKRAAVLADVDGNIMEFQDGYQTVLGERGVTVSGGQKQRISIARALLKDAPILILDDSVSAVDTGTEKTILENLRETRKGKTTILIAHRISTIRTMDKLIYIENNRIADVGTHEELYERCPGYRKMVNLQKLEEEGGADHA